MEMAISFSQSSLKLIPMTAASCNKWWMEEIIGTDKYSEEQKGIDKLGENHVYFLPYLMGERSPHNNPNARGTFIGMTMDTSRADDAHQLDFVF